MSKTIGIYAYIHSDLSIIGGIEAQVVHIAHELAQRGNRVIIHCLASDNMGIVYENQKFAFKSYLKEYAPNVWLFIPKNGYGLEGTYAENMRVSKKEKEEIIYCFGTRDGGVFEIAANTKNKLNIPLVSFVYFTIEERWWRSQFTERGKNIFGLTNQKEKDAYFNSRKNIVKEIIKQSDLVIVPTHYVRGQLLPCSDIQYSDKIKVCYHGINASLFPKPQIWKKGKDVLYASRIQVPTSCDKGFLWAVKTFIKENTNKKLYMCGNGNLSKLLPSFPGIDTKNIIIKGLLSQKDLFKLIQDCSFSLIPSMMEAGCTIAVESAMIKCLPIALDSAGLAEIMDTMGLSEYLVPAEKYFFTPKVYTFVPQTEKFFDLIENLSEKKVNEDLDFAIEIIRKKLTIEKTTAQLLEILEDVHV